MNPYEWRINDIERTASEAKNRLSELDSLRGDVVRLEYSVREDRAEIDGLRNQLASSEAFISELAARLSELEAKQ